jgi:hypothetical protein
LITDKVIKQQQKDDEAGRQWLFSYRRQRSGGLHFEASLGKLLFSFFAVP